MITYKAALQHLDTVQAKDPEMVKAYYPRHYREMKAYPDAPRLWAGAISNVTAHLTAHRQADRNTTLMVAYCLGSLLARHKVPTYYIAEDLIGALLETEPPVDMPLSELRLPAPAYLLVPPWSASRHCPPGHRLLAICCGLVPPHYRTTNNFTVMGLPARVVECYNDTPTFAVHTVVEDSEKQIVDYNFQMPPDGTMAQLLEKPFEFYPLLEGMKLIGTARGGLAEDRAIQKVIGAVLLHTLLLFNAEPEALEPKRELSAAVYHDKKLVRAAVWDPNFIGRKYQRIDKEASGIHASPATHLRRAHWHTYWTGEGRKTRSLKWVQWVYVNLKDKDNGH